MEQERKKTNRTITKQLTDKWGKPLIDAGYTAIPNVVLVRAQALGLDPLDVTIILHLASYWWHKDKPPFPSKKALADGIGVHVSTIRRRIAALEQGGLIRRVFRKGDDGGNKTNVYDLSPLAKAAEPFALEMLKDRADAARKKQDRLSRKGQPRLRSIK
ncbi:MAG: helix-turn-helix domain-containing protein [Acidiferrobacterales bacterium]|nr:helix-turn-helix domain-containing protein [Acidiferrobacterales bacterium]